MIQPLWRLAWRFLKKTKIALPYDLAIIFLGIYQEKALIQKDTCISDLPVVKNLLSNEGNMCFIPGPRRFNMPWGI